MMMNKSQWGHTLLAFLLVLLMACSEQVNYKAAPTVTANAPAMRAEVSTNSRAMADAPAQSAPAADNAVSATPEVRHIAYTHRYAIEAERAKLRAVLEAHIARCKQLDCVMVGQNFTEESERTPPSGALTVRVARKDKDKFVEALKNNDSRVLSQATNAQDMTMQVVDIEARMANLTQLRDRLRKLITDPKAGIKDVVEIERQLAQTQGELDSMQSQRRVLAQQTERELFEINYQAKRAVVESGILEPVTSALISFGNVFMSSVGALITFVAASFVWIVLLIVSGMLIRRLWRRRAETNKNIK